jgi:hypothetical protein
MSDDVVGAAGCGERQIALPPALEGCFSHRNWAGDTKAPLITALEYVGRPHAIDKKNIIIIISITWAYFGPRPVLVSCYRLRHHHRTAHSLMTTTVSVGLHGIVYAMPW